MLDKLNIPPHDETLENALLGGVISYPDEFSKIEAYVSDGSIFYQNKAKSLWKILKKMKMDNEEISLRLSPLEALLSPVYIAFS